jgi:acyl-coenzyme A synthetase/AMP-(fatty) acid ligase
VVQAAIVDDQGEELLPSNTGNLAIKKGWPSKRANKNKER